MFESFLRYLRDDEYIFEDDYIPKGYVLTADGYLFRPSFLALAKEEKEKICNGVGASEGLSRLAPDTVFGMSIRDFADEHDYDYGLGGTVHDRLTADVVFLNNMLRKFRKGSKILYIFRRHRAKLYFRAVRDFGFMHFGKRDKDNNV